MFKTVYSRMLTSVLALVLGLLVILGTVTSLSFRSFYIDEIENRLKRELDDICNIAATQYVDVDKRGSAAESFQMAVRLYDAYLQIYFNSDELGRYSVYNDASGYRWAIAEDTDLSGYAREALRTGKETFRYGLLNDYTGFDTLTVIRPIASDENHPLGVVFFHYDMTGVNTSIQRSLSSIVTFCIIAIAVAIPLVTILVRGMTNPITKITDVVKDFTRGNFSRRVAVKGKDELSNLGQSFNTMADELNTLEEARRSFVANVSHELRSPLTSMRGFLEAMIDGTIPVDERDGYMEIVLDENRRMTVMVNDLLDLARIESGQYKLNFSTFDINELMRRAVITFEARIKAKRQNITISLPEGSVYVEADSVRINQVLHNLIDNAVKYSPEDGRLSIECRPEKHIVRVLISNTGAGIPADALPHVFDRFYKAEKAHTPSGTSGTGLGLSIAKLIIDQHEQEIRAESENGVTCFSFTLKRVGRMPIKKTSERV